MDPEKVGAALICQKRFLRFASFYRHFTSAFFTRFIFTLSYHRRSDSAMPDALS